MQPADPKMPDPENFDFELKINISKTIQKKSL